MSLGDAWGGFPGIQALGLALQRVRLEMRRLTPEEALVRLINKSFIIVINSAFFDFSLFLRVLTIDRMVSLNNTKIEVWGWMKTFPCVRLNGTTQVRTEVPTTCFISCLLVYTLRYGLEAPSWFNGRLNGWTSFRSSWRIVSHALTTDKPYHGWLLCFACDLDEFKLWQSMKHIGEKL